MAGSLSPTIGPAGISAPAFGDILTGLQSIYQGIYGSDAYLGNDSQDGQFLAAIASVINDSNAACISVFNSFSPATAQGEGLSRMVKINGLRRLVPSNSTVDLQIVGVAGTPINNGIAGDGTNQWQLPATVIIPPAGTITVTATCATPGAVLAQPGAVNKIRTPTQGWQSVTNASAATPGNVVEPDVALRARQASSTALPSLTVLAGIIGAVSAVLGVTQVRAYENDTGTPDVNGIPGNKIALVVTGGDATAIANAIAAKKTPGGGTFGTTTVTVNDVYGIPHQISFSRPSFVPITAAVSIKALAGYTSAAGNAIVAGILTYIAGLGTGGGPSSSVEWDAALAAAKSTGYGNTYKILSVTLSRASGAGAPDVPIAFNEQATCTAANVSLVVN
ncbi:baseplate J/gp47 family protein [Chromobacterium subtsugae]|uniref:baseplate J/gp47 family protein n=1 Tax=Chromobacterium subtsugae TaxID=251747 RepID=UPI00064131F0|nr:baseplate J/gp47 family protein [Chromobacterium subtsugae]